MKLPLIFTLSIHLATSVLASAPAPIDRQAVVSRHNPSLTAIDYGAPLTVGNGAFAFTVDITGLQSFGEAYHQNAIPLETLARWCWVTEENAEGYTLADASVEFVQPNGKTILLPSRGTSTEAGLWLRRNPRLHPLGQLSLVWDDAPNGQLAESDIQSPQQTLDLWQGVITSSFTLAGQAVTVTTTCDAATDTIAVKIDSPLVAQGKLHARLDFPKGHDLAVKNTPGLDWTSPDSHRSTLVDQHTIAREVESTHYFATCSNALQQVDTHSFLIGKGVEAQLQTPNSTQFTLRYASFADAAPSYQTALQRGRDRWETFWSTGAAVDFAGSTNPLADKLEKRMILSRYLTAAQSVAPVPPQESGLTCNTWYGKHHTEMTWWNIGHFIPWGKSEYAETNLQWFLDNLPNARLLAESRGLRGARWSKMTGPDMRESPGGNPMIFWNQPHPIHLSHMLWKQSGSEETLRRYAELVLDTADCLATMLHFDEERGEYLLGPPLWIAQEIHDQATSQNPSFELAYWRLALQIAQEWREALSLPRHPEWDHAIAHMPELPQAHGMYVALESHPDTWDNIDSRHDHPQMLMPLGFLPDTDYVNRDIMHATLDGVIAHWDWEAKIWGWDYPMIAMTATRLGRPQEALEILLRDGPNNVYNANGHCPQGSDRVRRSANQSRPEIAVYLPANGSFLSTLALMVAGWEGCQVEHPGFPKDGTWTIRAEGLSPLL
ncbi:hypothetical protein IEN85_06505 [Pelagicoccus sp. NFK12]|uniref:Glycoside hydrolase family 65 n=1 Tax=Pelagicoccus enzymogenes TaxID=2773457 RepID=A0A927F651_9BACT|nr:hypothetical protein [Pelagicoccus enzymogenes]MBD5779138.1 hypothetical protein [Pelagicoccus enzymogenes]